MRCSVEAVSSCNVLGKVQKVETPVPGEDYR